MCSCITFPSRIAIRPSCTITQPRCIVNRSHMICPGKTPNPPLLIRGNGKRKKGPHLCRHVRTKIPNCVSWKLLAKFHFLPTCKSHHMRLSKLRNNFFYTVESSYTNRISRGLCVFRRTKSSSPGGRSFLVFPVSML